VYCSVLEMLLVYCSVLNFTPSVFKCTGDALSVF